MYSKMSGSDNNPEMSTVERRNLAEEIRKDVKAFMYGAGILASTGSVSLIWPGVLMEQAEDELPKGAEILSSYGAAAVPVSIALAVAAAIKHQQAKRIDADR